MGYFTSAFVLKEEPDWSSLASVAPSLALLGVKHNATGLCLLAIWGRGEDEPAYPYSTSWHEPIASFSPEGLDALPEVARQIDCVSAAAEVASDGYYANAIVRPSLRIGWLLERTLQCPLFFFAANDDGLDFAYLLSSGAIRSLRIVGDCGTAEYKDGEVLLKPQYVVIDDEDDVEVDIDFSPIEHYTEVIVHPTEVIREDEHDGIELFSAPVSLWPNGWADPKDALGLGTWDPLVNYPDGYTTCIVRR